MIELLKHGYFWQISYFGNNLKQSKILNFLDFDLGLANVKIDHKINFPMPIKVFS